MSYLIEIYLFCLAGIHLAPEDEKISITKVDECGRKSTFSYKSNLAEDMMTKSEYVAIKKFVGVHPKKKWLASVLWLLSELALSRFGKGR